MMGKNTLVPVDQYELLTAQHDALVKANNRITELEAATPEAYIAAIQKQAALEKELGALKANVVEYIGLLYDGVYSCKMGLEDFKELTMTYFSDVIDEITFGEKE